MTDKSPSSPGVPIPMDIFCPACGARHVDEGEWATRPHKTHQCQFCKEEWKFRTFPTVGVAEYTAPSSSKLGTVSQRCGICGNPNPPLWRTSSDGICCEGCRAANNWPIGSMAHAAEAPSSSKLETRVCECEPPKSADDEGYVCPIHSCADEIHDCTGFVTEFTEFGVPARPQSSTDQPAETGDGLPHPEQQQPITEATPKPAELLERQRRVIVELRLEKNELREQAIMALRKATGKAFIECEKLLADAYIGTSSSELKKPINNKKPAESEREKFEKWAKYAENYSLTREGDGYMDRRTRNAWYGWQARATSYPELPRQP